MSATIVALPGFLGRAGDWEEVRRHTRTPLRWICPEIFTGNAAPWDQPPECGHRCWLAGYSFGARLAMRWLTEFPDRWHGALLLSANPGNFQTDDERRLRKANDRLWARAFREEPWDDVLRRWNSQDVFGSGPVPGRAENDYDKQRLADALEKFSVGGQFTDVARLAGSFLWLAGGNDPKFCRLLDSMRQAGFPGTFEVVPGAGHRLLLAAPAAVAAALDRLTA